MRIIVDGDKITLEHPKARFTLTLQDDELVVVEKEGQIPCPTACGGELLPHRTMSVHEPHRGNAFDVSFKCKNCSFFSTFGNPTSEEQAEELRRFSRKWVVNLDEDVRKRLDNWGYW